MKTFVAIYAQWGQLHASAGNSWFKIEQVFKTMTNAWALTHAGIPYEHTHTATYMNP